MERIIRHIGIEASHREQAIKVEDPSLLPTMSRSINAMPISVHGPFADTCTNLLLAETNGRVIPSGHWKAQSSTQSVQLKGGRILAGPVYWTAPQDHRFSMG